MIGYYVSKGAIDQKVASSMLEMRAVFTKVESVRKFLENNPVDEDGKDPLVENFECTEDDAYAMRFVFEGFDDFRLNNATLFDVGRKMTGLE